MTSLIHSQTSVGLQEFKTAFSLALFVNALVKLVRVGSAPVGHEAAFHDKTKPVLITVTIKRLIGSPILRMPWRSPRKFSIPFVFEQGQIPVTGNGVLIGALQKHLPVHLSAHFSFCIRLLIIRNAHVFGLPAGRKLSFSGLFKGFVSTFVFGKLFQNLRMAGQIVPRPFGILKIQKPGGLHTVQNVGGPVTLKNNRSLQMIDIGGGMSRTDTPQNGECHE